LEIGDIVPGFIKILHEEELRMSLRKKFWVLPVFLVFGVIFAVVLSMCPARTSYAAAMSDKEFIKLCRSGTAAQVEEAIRNGANVNASVGIGTTLGYTPLMEAAQYSTPDVVATLIKAGAEVNASTNNGSTPLSYAAWYSTLDVVTALIKAGADVNASNSYGGTALMTAAQFSTPDVVAALIEAGADVNAQRDDNKETALWRAAGAEENGYENAEVLVRAGADVNTKNSSGRTLSYYLREGSRFHALLADPKAASQPKAAVPAAALKKAAEIGLYGIQLCIDLGPGAPRSLVDKTLGKPTKTESLGSIVTGMTYEHKGHTCAMMIGEADGKSMGAAYLIDARKLGMSAYDLADAIVSAAQPVYGQASRSDKASFRVKSKYLSGSGSVTVGVSRDDSNIVEIVQSLL
jgi:hypothetical protein